MKRMGWQQRQFVLFSLVSLLLPSGFADDPSSFKAANETASNPSSRSSTGLTVLYVCLGIIAVVLLTVFLFKKWQKKKREEQHARLLRLFEEDDELELELGLRD